MGSPENRTKKYMKRNILLCVAGGTPAIITETLWSLKEKGETVDEIRVITTKEGREKMLTGFLNGRGATDESLLDKEKGRFYTFQKDFPEFAQNIKFQSPESFYILTKKETGVPNPRDNEADWLDDILTDEDNEKIANQICEIVRELCAEENTKIHASIAGGRKTMSLYLMTAMQLFGRNWDSMSHVLVSKEVEFQAPKFFYKTPSAEPILAANKEPKKKKDGSILTTDDVNIYLAKIPFITLRGLGGDLFHKPISNFGDFVKNAQKDLNYLENANELLLNFKRKSIKVFNREAELTLREFFVYVMFAYFRKENIGEKGFVGLDEITENDLDKVCRLFVEADEDDNAIEMFREVYPKRKSNFLYKLDVKIVKDNLLEFKQKNYLKYNLKSPKDAIVTLSEASKKVMNEYRQIIDKASLKILEAKIDGRFDFVREGEKLGYYYGIKVDPNKITFEK